eukprot:m.251161 g.251161  ORF g.251161 m.251161 type:complete len:373 (-) comp17518_c0_seq2:680-1798(-)
MVKVSVKPPSGDAIEMDVELSMKVSAFRQAVADKVGDPKNSIRLVCSGHVLKDEKTLAEHNIVADAKIHLVRTARRAAPAQPAASAGNSLFAPTPAGASSQAAPSGEAMRVPPEMASLLRQLQANPQAQAMFVQMLQNPAMLQQLLSSSPGLANNPEAMAMFQNPEFLRQLADPRTLAQMARRPAGEPAVSREVFQVAMQAMTGGEIPANYPRVELRGQLNAFSQGMPGYSGSSAPPMTGQQAPSPAAQPSAGARRVRMMREIFTRDAVRQAIATLPTAQPAARMETDAEPQTSTPSQPAASQPAASQPAVASQDTPSSGETPASGEEVPATVRYEAQLRMLGEMGFTDPVACVQALEATNGDVNAALQFLF